MKIGIIGVGNMGGALGSAFARQGHEVMFSFSRNLDQIQRAAEKAGATATAGSPAEAVAFGDVVLLAVPWAAVGVALEAAGPLEDKILISCVNPLTPDYRGLEIGTTTSGAEEVAKIVPKARVVEAFLNIFAGILDSGSTKFGDDLPSAFYCGDDAEAKAVVRELISDIGLEPIDSGPLQNARLVEPAAALVLYLGVFQGMAREWKPGEFTDLSVKLLRR
jgi:NADPH-dependent F420 reductase